LILTTRIFNMELITNGAITTLILTLSAAIAGLGIGIGLAVTRTLEVKYLNTLAKAYINTFRSLPLVMVLLGFYLVAPGLLRAIGIDGDIRLACAIIAFSLFEAAYFAEILRSGINSIPASQKQACKSLGFTTWESYKHVLIPQALKNSFPVLMTQGIVLFQDTALVYIIGLTDLFGSAVKMGEMKGNITDYILMAAAGYMVICVVLQRVANSKRRVV